MSDTRERQEAGQPAGAGGLRTTGGAGAGPAPGSNYDPRVVDGFGSEWQRFNQRSVEGAEALELFNRYFGIFPWSELPEHPCGFDAGCGSGRWARFVAPRVGTLHCIDPSADALQVAAANLTGFRNCELHLATVNCMPMQDGSQDFGYSLGVLHHIPDTMSGLRACVRKLKPGAPFLLYLYYAFDNRPAWFRMVWRVTDRARWVLSRFPFRVKSAVCDLIALTVYWPLARAARSVERMGAPVEQIPLSAYRNQSLYVMRTDALDRFGTRLEKRFTRDEMAEMMEQAGLTGIRFHEGAPFWVGVGRKRGTSDPDAMSPFRG